MEYVFLFHGIYFMEKSLWKALHNTPSSEIMVSSNIKKKNKLIKATGKIMLSFLQHSISQIHLITDLFSAALQVL